MIVRHNEQNGDYLIAFRDSIWIVDEDSVYDGEDPWSEIAQTVGLPDGSDINDLKNRPDVLTGGYNTYDNTLFLISPGEGALHPVTSTLIKKVTRQLGIDNVSVEGYDYVEHEYSPNDLKGKLPKFGYHGTSLRRLQRILKTGIVPQNMGNWGDIHTEGAIFFAVDENTPKFHSQRTAHKDRDIPVIIKFEIPDEARIFADFDASANLYGSTSKYTDNRYRQQGIMQQNSSENDITQHHKRPQNLWKNTGVFGYDGRIPPSFFTDFYTTFDKTDVNSEGQFLPGISPDEMVGYMKVYEYVVDNFGDVEMINPNWYNYTPEQIMDELTNSDDEDEDY